MSSEFPASIETAPKDGTYILAWVGYGSNPVVCSFRKDRWISCTEHVAVHCGSWCQGGYCVSEDIEPISWMPIPKVDI